MEILGNIVCTQIRKDLTRLLETGKWGMATNHVKLQIIGDLRTDDIVESKVWARRITGDKNSVVDLVFEWFKVLIDGKLEKVASGEQRVSWIQQLAMEKEELNLFLGL